MKVDVEAETAGEPLVDDWGLVGGEVVTDQVRVELGGHGLVDADQEPAELGRAVTTVQFTDHGAASDVEGSEQTAVPWRS